MKSEIRGDHSSCTLASAGNRTPQAPAAADGRGDLPRERLGRCGAAAMKDYELLAIVLGTGYKGCGVLELARAILDAHPKEDLMAMEAAQLGKLKGLGKSPPGT